MTISLSEEQEARLQHLLDAGIFDSPEELVDYALTLAYELGEKQRHWLLTQLREAQEDIAAGRVRSYARSALQELSEDVKRRGRQRSTSAE